jgi:hypothetical protein
MKFLVFALAWIERELAASQKNSTSAHSRVQSLPISGRYPHRRSGEWLALVCPGDP